MLINDRINLRRVNSLGLSVSVALVLALLTLTACKAPADSPGSAVEPADASGESAAAPQSAVAAAPNHLNRS